MTGHGRWFFLRNQKEPEAPTANLLKIKEKAKCQRLQGKTGNSEQNTPILTLSGERFQGTQKERKKIKRITNWS
jgi:hypothetical protein